MGSFKENSLLHSVFKTDLSASEAFIRSGARNIAGGGIVGALVGSLEIGVGIGGLVTFVGVLPVGTLLGTNKGAGTSGYRHGPGQKKRLSFKNGRLA